MKKVGILLIIFFITTVVNAQKINGQWRGYFNSNGDIVTTAGDNTEYVLEIDINGSDITGYSYSYFQDRKYYVICSLKGTYNKSDKTILVTETARIKGLTPPGWSDCLQIHYLKYQKEAGLEELVGKWKAVPGLNDCGSGTTTLIRKTLPKITGNSKGHTHMNVSKPTVATDKTANQNKATPPVVKREVPTLHIIDTAKKDPVKIGIADTSVVINPVIKADINYEKRTNTLLKTIEIENGTFQVDLYDSGDIDGDSVSLFYNGRLILSHQRLTEKPITLTLNAANQETNELVMYAETLGTIPPNTALMVVTDGNKRYEVYIASDLQQSGTIRFVHKNKNESENEKKD